MALHTRANCQVCTKILDEDPGYQTSKLYKLIQEVHLGSKKMTDINRMPEYSDMRYNSMLNHMKKHQNVTERKLAKTKAETQHKKQLRKAEEKLIHHTERRTSIMDWIQTEIEQGNVKPTASAIVALLGQEAKMEEAQKDRELQYAKLYNAFIANPLPPKPSWDAVEGEIVEPGE